MITLTKADWKRLQWSIALFFVLALAGAAIALLSNKTLDKATQANKQATTMNDEARRRISRARDEEQELREKITVYQALNARGIIGLEHRLDWVEQIRKIKEARKLINVNYELGPQTLFNDKPTVNAASSAPSINGFDIMSSPMTLDMALLHENDLLGFLADLRNNIQGYIRIRRCDVSRNISDGAATQVNRGPMPQMNASCKLDWITIREKR